MKGFLFGAVTVGLVVAVGSQTLADTVWSQPGGAGPLNGSFRVSDNSLSESIADQFSLSQATSITSVRWWGVGGIEEPDPSPTDNIEAFLVTIYESSGGLPGAVAYSTSIDIGSVSHSDDPPGNVGIGYQYNASLSGANLVAGNYFFSVVADAIDETPGTYTWAWQLLVDNGGDGWAYENTANHHTWSTALTTGNMAFELFGTIESVPLPVSALLGGVGLLGLVPLRRRAMKREG